MESSKGESEDGRAKESTNVADSFDFDEIDSESSSQNQESPDNNSDNSDTSVGL